MKKGTNWQLSQVESWYKVSVVQGSSFFAILDSGRH